MTLSGWFGPYILSEYSPTARHESGTQVSDRKVDAYTNNIYG